MRLGSYMAGFALVVGTTGLALFAQALVRRRINPDTLRACHEVGGYLLSVVGTLYAVLLGLIVVDAMAIFQEAHQTTVQEANALTDVILLAKRMPEEPRARVLQLATRYADLVVNREWDTMDHGRHLPEARETAIELLDAVVAFEPKTESEKTLHDAQVDATIQLWNSRRNRTVLAAQTIPMLKWLVLVLGGVITVFFTFFFTVENGMLQGLMTALITVIIVLNIFLVLMFGYPFSGDLRVDPTTYRAAHELANLPSPALRPTATATP
ncbi:MAG: DUF4239 domain-containing protein [Isosphaeraceae bacterium]|nr:DUF4239 domain-containing protein [Isosphaeraceae bacterium]